MLDRGRHPVIADLLLKQPEDFRTFNRLVITQRA